jgi:nitrate/TMAO reductase-like tetraheme cytochrome c subunit
VTRVGRLLNKIGLTTWKRRIIAVLIVLPLFGITSVEVTSQSWFCNSCHIMNPYYDSWKHGPHKDVECVKCHISPGVENFIAAKFNGLGQVVDDVLHRTSMKPSASVSALACTRTGCHTQEKVRHTEKTTGKYLFRHDKHLDLEYSGIKIACATCHSHVKGDTHFEVNTNVCVTCHLLQREGTEAKAALDGSPTTIIRLGVREKRPMIAGGAGATLGAASHGVETPSVAPAGASAVEAPAHGKIPPEGCTSCHNPPAGTIERGGLKITHAEYLAYGASCESCHRGTTAAPVPVESGQCYECHSFGLEKMTTPEEMHRIHNEGRHKIECFSCHGTVHHGPTAQAGRLDQFECIKCHTDQHGVQRRTYLHKDEPAHATDGSMKAMSPMFMAHVDCTGCHIQKRPVGVKPDSGATVAYAVPEACDACHKPGLGAEMIPLWQKTTHKLYDQVTEELKSAEATVTSDEGKALLEEVRDLQRVVRADGSWGVHNPKYTQQALEKARNKITAARGETSGGESP